MVFVVVCCRWKTMKLTQWRQFRAFSRLSLCCRKSVIYASVILGFNIEVVRYFNLLNICLVCMWHLLSCVQYKCSYCRWHSSAVVIGRWWFVADWTAFGMGAMGFAWPDQHCVGMNPVPSACLKISVYTPNLYSWILGSCRSLMAMLVYVTATCGIVLCRAFV